MSNIGILGMPRGDGRLKLGGSVKVSTVTTQPTPNVENFIAFERVVWNDLGALIRDTTRVPIQFSGRYRITANVEVNTTIDGSIVGQVWLYIYQWRNGALFELPVAQYDRTHSGGVFASLADVVGALAGDEFGVVVYTADDRSVLSGDLTVELLRPL